MKDLPISDSQWIFDPSHLDHTPSREDGISLQDELERRKTCIRYIRSLGLRAGQPSWKHEATQPRGVMPTASTLVHRFYMRRSFKDFGEMLVAPTILFLASKIEEQSLKLRFIVNACLDKWEPGAEKWNADAQGNYPPQSPEYRRWEKEILATEELALEVLCFNMAIEHPWVILQRSVRGLQTTVGKRKITERMVCEVARNLLNETLTSPLAVTTHPYVLAFTAFVLATSMLGQMSSSQALAAAAERAEGFDLDVRFDAEQGAVGEDVTAVKSCLEQYLEYSRGGLIGGGVSEIVTVASDPPYSRRFAPEPRANGHTNDVVMEDKV